ncbi:hypothetical protein [Staphylococcus argensis]|uniref:hypothetical protein n=1 Tax=Staphylococcus argensis TaxID=1607738 RepID=UPI001642577F|nr:hypothetical protein [Staphylococcus argensis]MCY6990550.1 hypothetical protein [Staphylococcus argensis]
MKKSKVKGSLLMDGLLSLSTLSILCLLLFPLMLRMNHTLQEKHHTMEMKRLLAALISREQKLELMKGLQFKQYEIYYQHKDLCISDKETEICYPK